MGALPKKKRTRSRIGNRQAGYQVSSPAFNRCSHCRSPKLPHRICSSCGYYNGREIIAKATAPEGN